MPQTSRSHSSLSQLPAVSEEKLGVKQLEKQRKKNKDVELTNVYVQSLWRMIGSITSPDSLGCLIHTPTGLQSFKAWRNALVFSFSCSLGFRRNNKDGSKRIQWKRRENLRKVNLGRKKEEWFQKSLRDAEFLRTNTRAKRMEWMGLEK